jgi:hypothetical protein
MEIFAFPEVPSSIGNRELFESEVNIRKQPSYCQNLVTARSPSLAI